VVSIHIVTFACEPLRARITIDGQAYARGLYWKPKCPSDAGVMPCFDPPAGHDPCVAACEVITAWQYDPPTGGTAYMHVFEFDVLDDGGHAGPLSATVEVSLATLDSKPISDDALTVTLPQLYARWFLPRGHVGAQTRRPSVDGAGKELLSQGSTLMRARA
jgi:hypothetical protein